MNQTGPILRFLGCQDGVWALRLLIFCDAVEPQAGPDPPCACRPRQWLAQPDASTSPYARRRRWRWRWRRKAWCTGSATRPTNLVLRLLGASAKGLRATVLSGDVHVAALGEIESPRSSLLLEARSLTQLSSSGVTHPAPAGVARYFLEQACQQPETLEPGITGYMLKFPATQQRLIGCRNVMTLQADPPGGADRLWIN